MKKTQNELYHTTAVYRGKSYVTRECITGKLSFFSKDGQTAGRNGAAIVVITTSTAAAYLATDDDASSTVAVVFVGEQVPEALCAFAGDHELPLLILGKLSAAHDGKIAILDSRTATLFVDPDLDTLAHYARHLRLSIDRRWLALSPVLCSCHRALSLTRSATTPLLEKGRMLSAAHELLTPLYGEEALFEALCDLCESAVGVPMILPVRIYDLDTEQAETDLRLRLRALLRAAVYAPLSPLLEGLYTAASVKAVLDMLDDVSRELTAEGREHNRQLPIGLAIESWLLLHELNICPPTDYVCLDWDRLLRTALPPFAGKTPPLNAKDAFLHMLHAYTTKTALPICARTVHAPMIQAWRYEDAVQSGICTLFVPEVHLNAWSEWRETPSQTQKETAIEEKN